MDLRSVIAFENHELLALNKPAGLPSQPLVGQTGETAVSWALEIAPELSRVRRAGIAHPELEPGLLHRLDLGTSGLLLFAKKQALFDRLVAKWQTPAVLKEYLALSLAASERIRSLPWEIKNPIRGSGVKGKRSEVALTLKPRNGDWRRTHTIVTEINPHLRLPEGWQHREAVEYRVRILTGVRHQIRAHLSSQGAPLLGDPLYDGPEEIRLALHCTQIELKDLGLVLTAPSPWGAARSSAPDA